MPRKVRIQFAEASYHVMNRGNYRAAIFETAGARRSFLKCLEQCCLSQGWHLHAWALMPNHYHLCLHTPAPNLVKGMSWIQSTFANRFNRYRKENGHVFQGRYKAILLGGDAVGPVCHYIHLNPVRAGLAKCEDLPNWTSNSFHQLWHARRRWPFSRFEASLEAAGGLKDKPHDRRLYLDYLQWLQEEDSEKKRLGFDRMSRGWAIGGGDFKKEVLKTLDDEPSSRVVESEASELREPRWERATEIMMELLGRSEADLHEERKGAPWKVAMARLLRERYLAPHRWIAKRLSMGTPAALQSLVSRHRRDPEQGDSSWSKLRNHEYLD